MPIYVSLVEPWLRNARPDVEESGFGLHFHLLKGRDSERFASFVLDCESTADPREEVDDWRGRELIAVGQQPCRIQMRSNLLRCLEAGFNLVCLLMSSRNGYFNLASISGVRKKELYIFLRKVAVSLYQGPKQAMILAPSSN